MQNGSEIIIGRPQYLEQLKKWKNQPDLIKRTIKKVEKST